jgi:hypothetical protein
VNIMKTLLIATLLSAGILPAADVSGTWLGELSMGFNGDYLRVTQQIAIKLVQSGNELSGKQYSDYQSAPIIQGKITGDQVDFVIVAQEQQSNQITESRLHYIGRLQKDGTIEVTRTRESATNAGNSGGYDIKAAKATQTFTLRRLPTT